MSRALGARFYNACRIRHPRQACWSRSTDFHRHYLHTTTRPFASRHGIEVRSTSAEAIELYDTAVSEYLALRGDPAGHLQGALDVDSKFHMARLALGFLHLLSTGHTATTPAVSDAISLVECAQDDLTPRERVFGEALRQWAGGRMRQAAGVLEAHLLSVPRDALAIRCLHDTYFFLGDKANTLHSVARVLPAWDKDMPEYGRIAGMLAFGLQENRLFDAATDAVRTSLDSDPSDVWALHAMAHVYETTTQHRDGLNMITSLEHDWGQAELLKCHMQWHTSLFHISLGEHEAALERFDAGIREDDSALALDLCDASSMLWRLELDGIDVGDRWGRIAELWQGYAAHHVSAFNDVHIAMSLAAAELNHALAAHTASRTSFARERALEAQTCPRQLTVPTSPFSTLPVFSHTGLPMHDGVDTAVVLSCVGNAICDAVISFRKGDYSTCATLLLPVRHHVQMIGGSDAQRDLVELTLVHAAMRSDDPQHVAIAAALLRERMLLRPGDQQCHAMYDGLVSQHRVPW